MQATFAAACLLAVSAASASSGASALTLYDPGLATLPSAQQWSTSGIGAFSEALSGGKYVLSTAPSIATRAGSVRLQPLQLDTHTGFSLDFGLRIASEAHSADNQRSGFSLIVTGADPTRSLELGFWQDEVFAYTAGFAPGTSIGFDTTAATAYSLVVGQDQYSLLGNGVPLLTGSLVDYTGSNIAPYTTGGVIFFGDDTSRAQSVSELGVVTLTPAAAVPEPATLAMLATGGLFMAAVLGRRRRRAPR